MIYEKTRWKWHECLQARNEIINNDSECENDDYTIHQQGLSPKFEYNKNSSEDLFFKQEKLKKEATLGFILSAKMARKQVEFEREISQSKRLSLYEFIGINADIHKPLSIDILKNMNIGQLQVIINDLYCQIETNNNELINLLIERDSLSMEQDSILVDIEDLSRRIQERTNKHSLDQKEYIYILKQSESNYSKQSILKKTLNKFFF